MRKPYERRTGLSAEDRQIAENETDTTLQGRRGRVYPTISYHVRMDKPTTNVVLRKMYDLLWSAYGPQHWWPARTPTEVVIGAILTQNTAWTNVERAIANLRAAKCLTWKALRRLTASELEELIRPAGTYRVKSARLMSFIETLWSEHQGSLDAMLAGDLDAVRRRLLAVHGVGPETADAILLYAAGRAIFVVDAYTKRVLRRHRLIRADADYLTIQRMFHQAIPSDVQTYNEYHALLVAASKHHCRSKARCGGCPLESLPHDAEA